MQFRYRKSFTKSVENLMPKIQVKARNTLVSFTKNPFDPELRNHKLNGKWLGCNSIDVTWDIRIIFCELSDGRYELIELIKVGSHSQLY